MTVVLGLTLKLIYMYNITTIENGFIFNSLEYTFEEENEIISDCQILIGTNQGVILLDLSCTINDVQFTDINLFIQSLKGE
jgi:hypothetical protein